MLRVNKKLVDDFIESMYQYEQIDFRNTALSQSDELVSKTVGLALDLEEKTDINWGAWMEFVSSVVRSNGFNPRATKEDLYKCLAILGLEIVE